MNKGGFTLIELSVVIIALALVFGVVSVSKKLVSNAGSLVALNQSDNDWESGESSDSAEEGGEEGLPVTSGLILWLDASDADTITESGGNVSQWDDKSNAANHAVQTSSSAQPDTNSSTINSLNVIDFEQGSEFLDFSSRIDFTNTTIFVVAEPNASSVGGQILSATSANRQTLRYGSSTTFSWGAGGNVTFSGLSGNQQGIERILVITYDADNLTRSLNIDGSTITNSGNSAYNGSSYIETIGKLLSNSPSAGANIAEIIMYNTVLSSSDIATMESYLSDKWAITLDGP